jgi:hypothetical protein
MQRRSQLKTIKTTNTALRTTTVSVYASSFPFTYTNLLGDFAVGKRTVRLKKVTIKFNPFTYVTGGIIKNVMAQLSALNLSQSATPPVTDARPLSNSVQTVLSYKPDVHQNDWYPSNSSNNAFYLTIYNADGTGSQACPVYMTIDTEFELSPYDIPSNI